MSMRYQRGGFISDFYNPLEVPDAPTIGTATAGDGSASVTFTAPSDVGGGAITEYGAVSTPGGITGTSASSPVTVAGLTNGTSYTFQVWAINSYGPSAYSGSSGSVSPAATRGVFAGGGDPSSNIIQYISVSTLGNTTDFGDLPSTGGYGYGCASSTRGVFGGISASRVMQYITIATTGNSTTFGNLLQPYLTGPAACNSSTRGIFAGGYEAYVTGTRQNVIQYITIATTGDATDFGDLTSWTGGVSAFASCSSSTRGIFAGGQDNSVARKYIDYITIASTGNSTFFGNLIDTVTDMTAGCSNSTRGLFAGGNSLGSTRNTIQYITIASTGDAIDFGDLNQVVYNSTALASSSRAVFGGGTSSGSINVMEYVTIASTGNSTDFGDLIQTATGLMSCSNGNGGVQ